MGRSGAQCPLHYLCVPLLPGPGLQHDLRGGSDRGRIYGNRHRDKLRPVLDLLRGPHRGDGGHQLWWNQEGDKGYRPLSSCDGSDLYPDSHSSHRI